jgi:cytochrome c
VQWLAGDTGLEQLRARGSAARGEALIRRFGCHSCHRIPGIQGTSGAAGPPLTRWSERHYIAGHLVNTPAQLVPWLMNPPALDPGTAMPDLGVSEEQAWDIAAYLYTLK